MSTDTYSRSARQASSISMTHRSSRKRTRHLPTDVASTTYGAASVSCTQSGRSFRRVLHAATYSTATERGGKQTPTATDRTVACLSVVERRFSKARSEEHTSELQSRENLVC